MGWPAYPACVIRDAVIHMNNEQPLVCDLREMPAAEDTSLVCTNLRLVDGKKPTFIDRIDSWFSIPMHIIRFVEIPLLAVEASSILALPVGPACPIRMPRASRSWRRTRRPTSCCSASGRSERPAPRPPATLRVPKGDAARNRRDPVLHSGPMTKNLVIVESPAKAKTIERYLGEDYKVLASYGHVRDLPENPGKGKLGVDVEHDFAPDYVISEDRRKQVSRDRQGSRPRHHRVPRHRP